MKKLLGDFHKLPVAGLLYGSLKLIYDRSKVLERAGHVVNIHHGGEEGASGHPVMLLWLAGQQGHQLKGGHGVPDIVQAIFSNHVSIVNICSI